MVLMQLGLIWMLGIAKVKPKKIDGSAYPVESGPTRRALKGYETTNEEMIIERADGACFPILVSASPIRNIQGKVTAARCYLSRYNRAQADANQA